MVAWRPFCDKEASGCLALSRRGHGIPTARRCAFVRFFARRVHSGTRLGRAGSARELRFSMGGEKRVDPAWRLYPTRPGRAWRGRPERGCRARPAPRGRPLSRPHARGALTRGSVPSRRHGRRRWKPDARTMAVLYRPRTYRKRRPGRLGPARTGPRGSCEGIWHHGQQKEEDDGVERGSPGD